MVFLASVHLAHFNCYEGNMVLKFEHHKSVFGKYCKFKIRALVCWSIVSHNKL